jgi:hypothetical protein
MGDIWNANALLLFLAFFIPGFIALQIYGLFVGSDDLDFAKQLPAVIGYSALHYAMTGWIVLLAPAGLARSIAVYVVVLVLPVLWPPVILLIRDPGKWREIFFPTGSISLRSTFDAMLKPERTPWDRVLVDRARFIRIRLKSGRFLGGYFGPGSVVSSYPCERSIFIAQAFSMDQQVGTFGSPIDRTGVLVQGADIEALETIELQEDEEHV